MTQHLTEEQKGELLKMLSDPDKIRELNQSAKERFDERWGIDPDSATEWEDIPPSRPRKP